MKAVVIHRYGGPEVMRLEEFPEPRVGPRDVLIDVHAASLNPIDYKFRERKTWPVLRPTFPVVLGCDVAGVVRAVGAEVKGFAPGDRVLSRLERERMGALAERVAAAESVVAHLPDEVDFDDAATLPLAGLTALQALREQAELKAGESVLILAGAGGVGSLAIQIAKILGAKVLATTSTRNVQFVKDLGADEVIDYTREDVAARARGVDVIFDTLGGKSELDSLRTVKQGGIVVGIGGMPDATGARDLLPWFARPVVWLSSRERRRVASETGARFRYFFMRSDPVELAELVRWVTEGRLRPAIQRAFALAEYAEAFAEIEGGHVRGKIIVRPRAAP